MENKQKTHVKKGLIIAAILIILDIILQLIHQQNQQWVFYVNSALLVAGIIISINTKGLEYLEKKDFSTLFGYGFQVSVVTTCILFIYTILSVYLVFPDSILLIYTERIKQAQQLPQFNLEQATSQKEMALKVIRISLISSVVMINLAVGIAGSLIGTIIRLFVGKEKDINTH